MDEPALARRSRLAEVPRYYLDNAWIVAAVRRSVSRSPRQPPVFGGQKISFEIIVDGDIGLLARQPGSYQLMISAARFWSMGALPVGQAR